MAEMITVLAENGDIEPIVEGAEIGGKHQGKVWRIVDLS